MNPSFRPQRPASLEIREEIFKAYIEDPTPFRLRKLAEEYNISLQRLDAIIRLTNFERSWPKASIFFSLFDLHLLRMQICDEFKSISLEDIPYG